MTEDLRRKLQDLQSLFDSGLLNAEDYAREKANLLAQWRQSPPAPVPTEPPLPLAPLPTVIALPLREYRDETHPVLKLWYACDSVELLLRLVVMLAVAERTWRGPLDAALRRRLHDCGLEQPSLGAWRALADALVPPAPDADALLPELPALLREALLPLLDGPVGSARTETTSFSALRNRLAHGGGIRRVLAERLVARWDTPFLDAMRHTAWLATVDLVVRDGRGGYGVLRGPTPQAQPYTPADPAALARAFAAGDAVALVRGAVALPLWPLALYGVPRGADPDAPPATELVPQVYVRRGEVRLQYNPLGADHLALSESEDAALHRFLELFRLVDETPAERTRRFTVRDFQDEIRQEARRLVGRASECAILVEALAATTEGVLWVWGAAGVGKSCLLAWLTAQPLAAPPPDTLVLPYRFRLGDERCNRETFLRFAGERLMAWLQLPDDPSAETMPLLRRLRETLARLDGKRVLFVLDGLDEIAALDPRFAGEVPLALAGPGIVWLCAGRPATGLPAAFAGARQPFPAGVPGMNEGDIRSLLLERIGPLRKHLLRHDREQGERVGNPFVEQVARAADGLPLYVDYVIHDIFAGLYRVLDGHERLPPSLAAYHENLLRRLSVGSLQQVLTPLAATLAVAQEPLAAPALAALLRRRGKLVPEGVAGLTLVEHGLAAIATLLKRAATPEGADGYTLYHHSLRQHMATSAQSRDAVATAREALADLAVAVPPDPAAPYLYRQGIRHLLELRRAPEALALLTRFAYLMDRLRALPDPDGVLGISADWRATLQQSGPLAGDDRLWEAFWREREHILRRGDERWPACKILLQLAVEHADDSPVTRQAEAWLADGQCDWVWLRNPQRIKHAAPNPCLRVFEGHTGRVNGATVLPDGRILSWSSDDTLRLWNPDSGETLAVLAGHTDSVNGATMLPDGRILSWSLDETLRLWDGDSGQPLVVLAGHTRPVYNATVLPDGRILSWSGDHTLRLWDGDSGQPLAVLAGHTDEVGGATVLPDGRLLSWSNNLFVPFSWDETQRLWDGASGQPLAVLAGHNSFVEGATVLPDGRILSWSGDHTLRLWDGASGQPLAVLVGHTDGVRGATVLPDGRLLSWSKDRTLRLWDGASGQPLAVLAGHTGKVNGATVLPDGRLLSWSKDRTLRLWDGASGQPLAVLAGHTDWVLSDGIGGTIVLPDGRLLSWSNDDTLRLWNPDSGETLAVLAGHTGSVGGTIVLPDGRLLSWSMLDKMLRLWAADSGQPLAVLAGHTDSVHGATVLPDGRILSWSADHTLRLWNPDSGETLAVLAGHTELVLGVTVLPDGRLLSWSGDHTLRLWDGDSGQPLAVLAGHTDSVHGATVLPDGRILSRSAGSADHTLRLWNPDSGETLAVLAGHTELVLGVTVLPDGRLLSWSGDHTLRLWDGDSGQPLAVLAGHTDWVTDATVLPDGRILSDSKDGARLWDGDSGQPLGHTDIVFVLPDGRLLSGPRGGTLRLWNNAVKGVLLATFHQVTDIYWLAPDLLVEAARARAENDEQLVTNQHVGWDYANIAGLSRLGTPIPQVTVWQADSAVTARFLLDDGTLVITLASGHVFCLKLHHGARRISLAELNTLYEQQTD